MPQPTSGYVPLHGLANDRNQSWPLNLNGLNIKSLSISLLDQEALGDRWYQTSHTLWFSGIIKVKKDMGM